MPRSPKNEAETRAVLNRTSCPPRSITRLRLSELIAASASNDRLWVRQSRKFLYETSLMVCPLPAAVFRHHHDAAGIADRQGTQQDRADGTEDGDVGRHCQRQRADDDHREQWRVAQPAYRESEILPESHPGTSRGCAAAAGACILHRICCLWRSSRPASFGPSGGAGRRSPPLAPGIFSECFRPAAKTS